MVRIRRTPVLDESDLHRRMEQMMERLILGQEGGYSSRGWVPRSDAHETGEGILVTLEIPGVKREAIEIVAEGRYLRVSGSRDEPQLGDCVRWHQMEIAYGPFERVIALPFEIAADGISAVYEDGFLKITIARRSVSRSVPISS